jgi:hypothetical protein
MQDTRTYKTRKMGPYKDVGNNDTPGDTSPSYELSHQYDSIDETRQDDCQDEARQDDSQDYGQWFYRFKQYSGCIPLRTGTRVIVKNLGVLPEFNGKPATVLFYNQKKLRYKVELETGKTLFIKAECVERTLPKFFGCLVVFQTFLLSLMQTTINRIRCNVSHIFTSDTQSDIGFRLVCLCFHIRITMKLGLNYCTECACRSLPSAHSLVLFFTPFFTLLIIITFYIATKHVFNGSCIVDGLCIVDGSCIVDGLCIVGGSCALNESLGYYVST